ncbi:MAG: DUF5522 domain-containing protein [Saprospiraceae bacterium]
MKKFPPQPKIEPLLEGMDYYIENGYWVFTEHFLRKRGYCCGSGCRHCPYRENAPTQFSKPDRKDVG